MSAPVSFRDSIYCIAWGNAPHTTPGAPDFDAITWTTLNTYALPNETVIHMDPDVKMRRPYRTSGARYFIRNDVDNDRYGSAPFFNLQTPFDKTTGDLILSTVLQDVTEGGTPFVKTFTMPIHTVSASYPDFSANEGAFAAFIADHSPATDSGTACDEAMLTCMPTSLTLSCYPDKNDGRLMINADMRGRYYEVNNTYTGTITIPGWSYFNFSQLQSILVNGTSMPCYGFTIKIDQDWAPVPVAGYTASGYSETNRSIRLYSVSGSIDLLYSGVSESTAFKTIIGALGTTSWNTISIRWADTGAATADGELVIDVNGALVNKATPKGTEERIYTLEFEGAGTSAIASPLTVSFCNNIDRGAQYTSGYWV